MEHDKETEEQIQHILELFLEDSPIQFLDEDVERSLLGNPDRFKIDEDY